MRQQQNPSHRHLCACRRVCQGSACKVRVDACSTHVPSRSRHLGLRLPVPHLRPAACPEQLAVGVERIVIVLLTIWSLSGVRMSSDTLHAQHRQGPTQRGCAIELLTPRSRRGVSASLWACAATCLGIGLCVCVRFMDSTTYACMEGCVSAPQVQQRHPSIMRVSRMYLWGQAQV